MLIAVTNLVAGTAVENTACVDAIASGHKLAARPIAMGKATLQQVGEQIFQRVLAVASGTKTKSEEFGFGDNEFLPWRIGAVM